MIIEMQHTVATPARAYEAGKVYDVPDVVGHEWCAKRLAQPSTEIPHDVRDVFNRLDIGKNGTALFLPFCGEFGHEIMTHVRIVHFNRAKRKIVCCRPGNQVLYPSADEFVTEWTDPVTDLRRVGTCRTDVSDWQGIKKRYGYAEFVPAGGFTHEQELCAINPAERIPFRPHIRGLQADVLLGIRHREFAPDKNWPRENWQRLADAITPEGFTFAIVGHRDTSYDLQGQTLHTGDYDTDAAIELMQQPNTLFVGTDSGATHLAATVGMEMVVFRVDAPLRHRNLVPRMELVNKGRILDMPRCWDKPDEIIGKVLEKLQR